MTGTSRRDDGWYEGRRDRRGGRENWPARNGSQPDASADYPPADYYATDGYLAAGYDNGPGYAGQDGYGTRASGTGQPSGTGGYPQQPYPGASRPAAGHAGGGYPGTGHDSAGYSAGGGYPSAGHVSSGYGASGHGRHGRGNPWNQSGRPSPAGREFRPADHPAPVNDNTAGTPRPYGRLSIFTLLDDKAAEFDRLAELAAEGVRTTEPDTLVYVIHVVPKAPMQRIIYEIYSDRAAFESHERQPHIRRFVADRKSCVLATNVIDLRPKYAKVSALGGAPSAAPPVSAQETHLDPAPRVPPALGPGTPSPASQAGPWYPGAAASGQPSGAAGRYPATGYPSDDGQYQAGHGQYGNGQYGASGQYEAADRAGRHGGD
jgi:quinol monooxygenase YgiN